MLRRISGVAAVLVFSVLSGCSSGRPEEIKAGSLTDGELPSHLMVVRDSLQVELEKINADLKDAAEEIALTGIDNAKARLILKKLAAKRKYFLDACTVSPTGKIALVEPEKYAKSEGADIRSQPQVVEVLKTKNPVLSGRFKAIEGLDVVDMEYPVLTSEGLLLGSVSVIFDPAQLVAQILGNVPETKEHKYCVIQTDGTMLYNKEPVEIGKNIFKDELFAPFDLFQKAFKKVMLMRQGRTEPYIFLGPGLKEKARKYSTYTTVGIDGVEWRVSFSTIIGKAE